MRPLLAVLALALLALASGGCGGGGEIGSGVVERLREAEPAAVAPAEVPTEGVGAPDGTAPPVDATPSEASRLSGEWAATGKVEAIVGGIANSAVGKTEQRPWAFAEDCSTSPCRILFLRGTLYGESRTYLVPHGAYFSADFPPVHAPCAHFPGEPVPPSADPLPGRDSDSYRLWWSADGTHLEASEYTSDSGCGGGVAHSTISWVAEAVPPSGATSY
jgi:hypothetical protein